MTTQIIVLHIYFFWDTSSFERLYLGKIGAENEGWKVITHKV